MPISVAITIAVVLGQASFRDNSLRGHVKRRAGRFGLCSGAIHENEFARLLSCPTHIRFAAGAFHFRAATDHNLSGGSIAPARQPHQIFGDGPCSPNRAFNAASNSSRCLTDNSF